MKDSRCSLCRSIDGCRIASSLMNLFLGFWERVWPCSIFDNGTYYNTIFIAKINVMRT